MSETQSPILQVEDLWTSFRTFEGRVRSVNGVSFTLGRGETLALVGESACGKSVTALSIMGLISSPGQIEKGRVLLEGHDLRTMSETELQSLRGVRIAMIFQNATAALDPMFTIGEQMVETYRFHTHAGSTEATARAVSLLDHVQVSRPADVMKQYPHEISIGTAQRVMIAMALLCNPSVLIADEPTTNLDSISQIEMLAMLDGIRRETGLSVILITHDFGVVARVADRVAVMYAGKIVEQAALSAVLKTPLHPYTAALMASVPRSGSRGKRLFQISGQPPDAAHLPAGCAFAPRCPHVMEICAGEPPVRHFQDSRYIRCFLEEGVQ